MKRVFLAALLLLFPWCADAQQLVSGLRVETCTNQVVTGIAATKRIVCSSVANAMLSNSSITLNAGGSTGYTAPGAMTLGSTYTFGATSDQVRMAGLGLGGAATGANQLAIFGATSGRIIFAVPAAAGTNTLTFPAGTTDFTGTGGASQVVKQTSSGGALTVARLTCADLSDGATGCSTALANLTATDTTLTFSGSYNGTTARTVGVNLANNNAWTKAQAVTPVALSISGGAVAVDASTSNDFTLTASGAFTLSNPSNLLAGQTLNFWITQDGTGSRVMTLGTQYQAAGGSATIILSTAASTKDLLTCVSDTTSSMTCALLKAVAH